MSKYYQQLQKNYKNIITQKMYSKNLINRVYFQKYIIAFNFLDFEKKSFKEIISKANFLELHNNSFKMNYYIQSKYWHCLNGDIYIYCTNKKELFFLMLEKITPFYFICYENFFFENNEELNILFLYEQHENNYNLIYFFIIDLFCINIFMLIYFFIINLILIV